MTDSEIIENLSKIDDELACAYEDCPIYRKNLSACTDGKEVCFALSEAKKLINRQKAEIERLKTFCKNSQTATKYWHEKAKKFESMVSQNEGVLPEYEKLIKFEAIKEFVERLCEDRLSNDPVVIAVKVELKEMVGDSDE